MAGPLQWGLGHKKPSTRNPTLVPQGSYRFVAWEPTAFHGKTLRNEETQGTLEGSSVFLGMGSHHCRKGRALWSLYCAPWVCPWGGAVVVLGVRSFFGVRSHCKRPPAVPGRV